MNVSIINAANNLTVIVWLIISCLIKAIQRHDSNSQNAIGRSPGQRRGTTLAVFLANVGILTLVQSVNPALAKLTSFLPASPKAKAGLGVQSLRPSVRPSVRLSVRPSVPKSCHRNSSETTDPIIMKLGMYRTSYGVMHIGRKF